MRAQAERILRNMDVVTRGEFAVVQEMAAKARGEGDVGDAITLSIAGRWADYHISFQWMDELEALHLACAFDLKVPESRRPEVLRLLAVVNEQLWVGHFDLWPDQGMVMYRHALLLAGGATASGRQCEALLKAAVDAAERYYPAFQFVIWAGKTAREAMDATLFETVGEA